ASQEDYQVSRRLGLSCGNDPFTNRFDMLQTKNAVICAIYESVARFSLGSDWSIAEKRKRTDWGISSKVR
ncbi:MAG: hypothetical protein ACXACI_08555, partial [Candidatus Hodarchaeales archaeon]